MVIQPAMPRYGTHEHKRLGMLLLATLVIAIAMLIPDLAFAAFTGSVTPSTTVGTNIDNSFKAWWKWIATPAFWVSMLWLAVCVLCFGSRGWQIPVILGVIFLFGEMVVNGLKALMV